MNKDLTQILVIQDRSGSMESVRRATIDGFNEFVRGQRSGPGDCRLRLIQFDHEYNLRYDMPIRDVPQLNDSTYEPRGTTALLDAIGRGLFMLGDDLKKTPEENRPGKVIVVIMTDGMENASKDYTRKKVFDIITQQRDTYKWEFIFLGANMDAIQEANALGINQNAAITYSASNAGTQSAYQAMNCSVLRSRSGDKIDFTDDERKDVLKGDNS